MAGTYRVESSYQNLQQLVTSYVVAFYDDGSPDQVLHRHTFEFPPVTASADRDAAFLDYGTGVFDAIAQMDALAQDVPAASVSVPASVVI